MLQIDLGSATNDAGSPFDIVIASRIRHGFPPDGAKQSLLQVAPGEIASSQTALLAMTRANVARVRNMISPWMR
jgi:hypothetical protein